MSSVVLKALLAKRRVFFFALLMAISSPAIAQEIGPPAVDSTNPQQAGEYVPDKEEPATLEEVQDEGEPSADIGEVVVEGAAGTESAQAPGAFTTVIDPARFGARSKSAPEMLSETVGVDVTSLGGQGQLSKVSIRGSTSEQVAVFVDGVPINSSLTGSVDFSTIPFDSIERIEVIRGSSSARFGTGAMGGMVNVVTKGAGAKRAIDAKLTGASFSTLNISTSWREPRDWWDLVLALNHRSTAGDFTFKSLGITMSGGQIANPATYTRLHNRSISEDLLAKLSFDITDSLHLALSNDFFWTERQVPGTEVETTQLYPANPLEADEEIFRNTSGIKLSLDELFVENLSFEFGFFNLYDHDHFTDPSPAIGGPIDVTYTADSPQAHAQILHELRLEGITLVSIARGQYRYDYAKDSSPIAGTPLMGSNDRHTPSLFVEEELALLDGRLKLVPSGRVEHASGRRTRASWRVGVVGSPADFIDLKANVGTAFRYPSFNELYYPDQGYLRGNPNLEDERSFSWDVGLVARPPRTTIEIAYFRSDIDNQILWVPISATTIQPLNTGGVRAQGVEFSFSTDPLEWLHLGGNYTWLETTYKSNGLRIPGRPRHKANGRAEVDAWKFVLFGEVQYVGDYPLNTANTVSITSHTSADVGATFNFAKGFFATFEVKDVTNVQIYDARGFPLPRRSYWVSLGART